MRVEHDGAATIYIFSRRNLLTLLAKLDGHPPDSACKIGAPPMYGSYWARAEEDEVHYTHPDREEPGIGLMQAGRMHPETEAAMIQHRDTGDEHTYSLANRDPMLPLPNHVAEFEPVPEVHSDGRALLAHHRKLSTAQVRQGIADTVLDPRD
jgi:hypothetical protein